MIGCMTFIVSDLLSNPTVCPFNIIAMSVIDFQSPLPPLLPLPHSFLKGINGWYQLLGEEKGKKENIAVPSALSKMGSVSSLASIVSAPPPPTTFSRNFAVSCIMEACCICMEEFSSYVCV